MVHLVGFTIEIHYDARPYERQTYQLNAQLFEIFFLLLTHSVTRIPQFSPLFKVSVALIIPYKLTVLN